MLGWHLFVLRRKRARLRGKHSTLTCPIVLLKAFGWILLGSLTAVAMSGESASIQSSLGSEIIELTGLRDRIRAPDTRTRVDAFHRVWAIGVATTHPEVKSSALSLLLEPVNSSSDHIRMPAVYAIAEIANRTIDVGVKITALGTLRGPLTAEQVPIRIVAIDAVSSIMRSGNPNELAMEVLKALNDPVRSGNNGVRIPAINAILSAAILSNDEGPLNEALDLLGAPLESASLIGGMEVRMMAMNAVERIGMVASGTGTKAKAMGCLQSYSNKGTWEPESRRYAAAAAKNIENSLK